MLCALNKLASRQANPTNELEKDIERFLHYAATHPSAKLVYRASGMNLIGHSDASYLSETGSRSRCGSFSSGGSEKDLIVTTMGLCSVDGSEINC